MDARQEEIQSKKVKAERLSPDENLSSVEFEELAGDDAPLIRSGHVQYWGVKNTVGQFSASAPCNVWHLEPHNPNPEWGELACELRAILNGFWEAQKPEYVTTHTAANWPQVVLMQSIGFQQVGYLPLTSGPVIIWGWRQCH